MTIYQLWHRDKPTFMNNTPDTLAAFPAGFTHIADVDTDQEGRVFQLTNHIDGDWTKNPEVTLRGGWQHRSTSVGDVITEFSSDKLVVALFGKRWTVQMIGLKEF